jgi:hypothetical protein
VLDNGPQFTAQEFEKYIERHQHNGQAEHLVKTFKQALKKNITKNTNSEKELVMARFLLDYRNAIQRHEKIVSR